MLIKIPVSVGELADKITILEIKKQKIVDKFKLINIRNEHKYLKDILSKKIIINSLVKKEISLLKSINLKLWDIENGKRKAEKDKKFNKKFINLARNVYIYNDRRARIKFNINKLTNSKIIEEKSYNS